VKANVTSRPFTTGPSCLRFTRNVPIGTRTEISRVGERGVIGSVAIFGTSNHVRHIRTKYRRNLYFQSSGRRAYWFQVSSVLQHRGGGRLGRKEFRRCFSNRYFLRETDSRKTVVVSFVTYLLQTRIISPISRVNEQFVRFLTSWIVLLQRSSVSLTERGLTGRWPVCFRFEYSRVKRCRHNSRRIIVKIKKDKRSRRN